uniref:C2H2-type domain-containing protein n=1 Tax=Photinus pyralis TaxID=7054 RepID=A0A1Y1JV24_PHOPY
MFKIITIKTAVVRKNNSVITFESEQEFNSQETLSKRPIQNESLDSFVGFSLNEKLNSNCVDNVVDNVTYVKVPAKAEPDSIDSEDSNSLLTDYKSYSSHECYKALPAEVLNITVMVRCQNCDTNFPTKYQYQRHQCDFNAEKVVLKADADLKDVDRGVRIKYSCITCAKQFVSKNNLERHQSSHEKLQENICEHCNKQFVSENRLRIHKENHCKKAGDISKFYRSDVTVWKCTKCSQVFSTPTSATYHAEGCIEKIDTIKIDYDFNSLNAEVTECRKSEAPIETHLQNVTKILTELLLQCEYCNRTYADKDLLVAHQRRHTTKTNYECITCNGTFESYLSATRHWMTKCSDAVNLFYLPKMTYCDLCDRTFKSHEILYTHKMKKKHYRPKPHLTDTNLIETNDESKDKLVQLIKTVLITLDTSIDKNKDAEKSAGNKENDAPIDNTDSNPSIVEQNEPTKKKRGRKRKWPKQDTKVRNLSCVAEAGYKYQCERCVMVFDTVTELESHRDRDHAANFSCEECGQVVHSAKALVIHSRAHQHLKPYVCEQCGRSYSQTSHLWQHMRFHQGIKPFACPHEGCEARYTIRPDLKDHIRKVHTRERPFKCTVCGKSFLTGSVYYQHRLIHTNDRRYGCDVSNQLSLRML